MTSSLETKAPPNPVASDQRGNRLRPTRSSRLYWHLLSLRKQVEEIVDQFIARRDYDCLVDYGCGNMPYRSHFEHCVSKYSGIDLPGNEMADVTIERLYELPIPSLSTDVVLSTQVLEHVSEPASYLGEAYRILRPNGLLILSTHGVWRYHPDPFDYWRWTSEGLRTTIEQHGFRLRRFRGVMGPAATGLQIYQDAVYTRFRGIFRRLFIRYMQRKIRREDLKCPDSIRDADASVYVVVAEKF